MSMPWSEPLGLEPKKPFPDACRPPAPSGTGDLAQKQSGYPIRVLIVDDHEIVRRGLRALLADAKTFEICAEAASGVEAIEKARQLEPDVVVIDVSMPGLNGLEATRLIVKEVAGAQVLVLSMHESEQLIEELLRAGARGYILKTDVSRDLPVAIESLHKKRPFFSSKIARKVLDGYLG